MTIAPETGHLFVVHGTIDTMVHDAAVVPVGTEFSFNPVWRTLVGDRPQRPERWSRDPWGRLAGAPDRVWAVSVGGRFADPYDSILDRVERVVRRVDERRGVRPPVRGRDTLPLLAVPVIGIGRGGYGQSRGEVLQALFRRLSALVRQHAVDIAVVTPDPSVYGAAQHVRGESADPLPGRLEEVARRLGGEAARGELALLLGAGVGMPAGLPSWHALIGELAREAGLDVADLAGAGLSATDQAELIERHDPRHFRQRIADRIRGHERSSLLHALLAGLDCREVVTTNYDVLYERAVRATGREIESVMPWHSAHGAGRWVLKLHGDVDHPESIVLTRRHMVRYDAAHRPSGALLQSLLLTKHLLAVGVSMTDDNVIRLAHEVQAYRDEHQGGGAGAFGTVLDVAGDPVRSRLWDGQLDWIRLPEVGPWTGPRAVELLLDRVAQHASTDSSWVLDPRFAGLIPDDERRLADQAVALFRSLPQRPDAKWAPLVERLRQMGADGAS